jgi:hypothetical protein
MAFKHVIVTVSHGGTHDGIYLQSGKAGPHIREGEYLRRLLDGFGDHNPNIHLLRAGDIESPPGRRKDAVNRLVAKYGKSNCLLIEPHVNASGMGGWKPAKGHRIIHNGKYGVVDAAKELDALHSAWIGTESRGVTNGLGKYTMLGVNCAAIIDELYFMTNREESDAAWGRLRAYRHLLLDFAEGGMV